MTESELTKIKEVLQTEYILLKKGALWSFLGGVFTFLIAAGFISYQAGLQAIKSSSAQRITNELEQLKINAKKSFFEIEKMRNELNSKNQAEINHLVDNVKKTTIEIEEIRNDLKSENLKVSFRHQKSWSVGPNKYAVKSFTVDATGVIMAGTDLVLPRGLRTYRQSLL